MRVIITNGPSGAVEFAISFSSSLFFSYILYPTSVSLSTNFLFSFNQPSSLTFRAELLLHSSFGFLNIFSPNNYLP
ncbi:hypothetical protein PPL_11673 [Heterostelium album PN500]|uniref:Uncharacterized protein n=1 Tax=Heterostelium pallidum (strain ATCC 26659 / Pp 5 / PN500) TaxID=670386 RepID=D3BU54_HETP5|nr:hypothetical protein PPL_11673 [Heterostelium album PN500]EFA75055.1 hypothetical protein PPL_11673 [Heterostelium album PN500]|eukprot:XP_020427189.1 hypothetical protein PPL_11673 [Heterostelium album PN500]